MTTSSPVQPPTGVDLALGDGKLIPKPSYLDMLCPPIQETKPLTLKPISYLHGEPRVLWEEEEIETMIIKEKLNFAVIGKFSYGWPEI
ncbi:hypothetical protein KY285_023796 [Solanum tuberosum]|nr:hypothetical protein KY289_024122 [Solanum tuberosum]KAH0675995.1 hypothetical protein KY285_023796 [Solanum tuberosum]